MNLLNEARENLEDKVDYLCAKYNKSTPRMYCINARRDYLNLAKAKKRTTKKNRKVVKQQLYMYENKVHTVRDRIVSISQLYIRPIVRGKAKIPVEFVVKLDLSLDERGIARIECLSYDAYNEAEVLIEVINNYKKRTGHYQERVLVDQRRMIKPTEKSNTEIIMTE